MNYITLVQLFWDLDDERPFTSVETRLYLLLLSKFNRIGMDRSVAMTNQVAIALLGTSLNEYLKARDGLVARGLITVDLSNVKSKRLGCSEYRLIDPDERPTQAQKQELPKQKKTKTPEKASAQEPIQKSPQEPIQVAQVLRSIPDYVASRRQKGRQQVRRIRPPRRHSRRT